MKSRKWLCVWEDVALKYGIKIDDHRGLASVICFMCNPVQIT